MEDSKIGKMELKKKGELGGREKSIGMINSFDLRLFFS
jgi:hypothetical protein